MIQAEGGVLRLDAKTAADFLRRMLPTGAIHLFAIYEGQSPIARTFQEGERSAMGAWIRKHQQSGANIYFSVNPLKEGVVDRKASKQDVAFAHHLHVDIDDPNALAQIKKFIPPPTTVVFSGGGYQAFWTLRAPEYNLEAVEQTNAAIAAQLGGDHCHNIDRIMRVPATVNYPNKKKRERGRIPSLAYEVTDCADPSRVYRLADFAHLKKSQQRRSADSTANALPTIRNVTAQELPAFVTENELRINIIDGDVRSRFASRSEHLWYVACQLVHLGLSRDVVAGILSNPDFEVSASILDNADPDRYLKRQVDRAFAVWPAAGLVDRQLS